MRKDENNENIDSMNSTNELINSEETSEGITKQIEGTKSYSELESELINKDMQIQNLNEEVNQLRADKEEKDKIIRAQAAQLNLYITKNNKNEITIDALQDKLLALINSINN